MPQVAIHAAENELAGLNVNSPSLSFVEIGKPEPGVQITANGQPLTATVVGARQNVIFLSFDPRPLVEQYPTGFEVLVTRDGEVLHRLDLSGATEAFKNLMECSRTAFG